MNDDDDDGEEDKGEEGRIDMGKSQFLILILEYGLIVVSTNVQ